MGKRQGSPRKKILQEKLQEKGKIRGESNGNKFIKKLLNILRQHFPGCAISKANCRSPRLIYRLSNWVTNWQTEWLSDWLSHCEAALGLWWMFPKRHLPIVWSTCLMHFLSLLFTFIIIIVYAEPKKIRQRQYAFICNLLAFNLFIISLHLFCGQPFHFALSCLVLASIWFPTASVENFHQRKASFWTA